MTAEEINWRALIVKNLIDRNRRETNSFNEIITQNNRLLDTTYELKSLNLKLSVENEQLRSGSTAPSNGTSAASAAKISHLESKLLAQQEQLTDLHKRKGENAQMIIDLNLKLEKQNKLLGEREATIADHIAVKSSLRAEVLMLTTSLQELKSLNSCLRDEHCALQLAFASLEEKLRKVQDENRTLVDRLIKYKAKDAEKLNEENESFLKKRSDKMRKELEDAAREGVSRRSNSPVPALPDLERAGSLSDLTGNAKAAGFFSDGIPKRIHLKFDAHDGEVNAVRWSPVEPLVATGGADRKVNLWDVGKAKMEPRGILIGSNAAVNSVEFDSTGSMVLATSNDYASRVWTVSDQRLRHTLTGHSGKVMAAKFLGEPSKVVTGSHDRTLKIWDLRSRACVETKFAGSSCNDLVTTGTDVSGTTIISGHYDKKIRFWDTRTDCSANEIVLQGKITSLDLSKDCQYLLSCVRDDTIKLLDLRMNQIIKTFSNDNFKVSCDWSRVSFSRDTSRIAAGSNDGAIFIWNINGQLEGTLKENSAAAVTAVSWNPFSSVLATVDRAKTCIIWSSA
ncbi:autophagy-related protein 16 isoform X4 [Contarinia nasturtii]|uniref:autophagy-related protein 16 isoform X4 n=1 Tax=Contarinia nasturtii TaxID=265458 RepID=UPI0012D3DF4F|nr:autophagy-related protein 16 isoform X4 [Contarinia nasturtii]